NDKNELPKLFKRLKEKELIEASTTKLATNEIKVENKQTVAYFKFNDDHFTMSLPVTNADNSINLEKTHDKEMEIFWEIFGRFSSSRKYVRLSILILLTISGTLFLITFVEHVWTGLKYFSKAI